MIVETPEWGPLPQENVIKILCPYCNVILNGKIHSPDRVQMPKHECSPNVECTSSGLFYTIN